MTATRSGPRELAESVGRRARELAGMVRRMIVTRAQAASRWQVADHDLSAIGGDEEPTRDAENFAGVGFAARPSSDSDAGDVEAVLVFPGGPGNPIIVATRQEAARRIVAADLAADETQIHGAIAEGGTIVRIMADGTVEIRTVGGTALALPTLADVQAIYDAISSAAVVVGDGGAAFKTNILAALASWPTGTTVLKAE